MNYATACPVKKIHNNNNNNNNNNYREANEEDL
jgi:hypothetical protein